MAYTLFLDKDGEQVEVNMRLTLGAQKALENEYHENSLMTLLGAMDSPSKMANVFKQALNYKGNTNTIKSGEELYDLITDNGLGGVTGFKKILSGIGQASGILNEEERTLMDEETDNILKNQKSPQQSTT